MLHCCAKVCFFGALFFLCLLLGLRVSSVCARSAVVLYNVFCSVNHIRLGPRVVPFYPFLREGFPTKIDYIQKKVGPLILTSRLEDLIVVSTTSRCFWAILIELGSALVGACYSCSPAARAGRADYARARRQR